MSETTDLPGPRSRGRWLLFLFGLLLGAGAASAAFLVYIDRRERDLAEQLGQPGKVFNVFRTREGTARRDVRERPPGQRAW